MAKCLVCDELLNNPVVPCELCESNFHKTCVNLTQYQFKLIRRKNVFYRCPTCCEVFPYQNKSDYECICNYYIQLPPTLFEQLRTIEFMTTSWAFIRLSEVT